MPQLRSEFKVQQCEESWEKWRPWESLKVQTITDQMVSHLSPPKNILLNSKTEIFCGLPRKELKFLENVNNVTSGIKHTAFDKYITIEHGGRRVMVRGCFAALIDGNMNSALCQKILKKKCPAVCLCPYV